MEEPRLTFFAGDFPRGGPSEKLLEDIWKIAQEMIIKKNHILEEFSRAYLAETGLMPSEVEMIWQDGSPGQTRIWFEKKRTDKGAV